MYHRSLTESQLNDLKVGDKIVMWTRRLNWVYRASMLSGRGPEVFVITHISAKRHQFSLVADKNPTDVRTLRGNDRGAMCLYTPEVEARIAHDTAAIEAERSLYHLSSRVQPFTTAAYSDESMPERTTAMERVVELCGELQDLIKKYNLSRQ